MSEQNTTIEELQQKLEDLESRYLGSQLRQKLESTPFTPRSTVTSKIASISKRQERDEETDSKVQTKLPMIKIPEFQGIDLEDFLDDFERWLRLTGLQNEPPQTKLDWLIEACQGKTKPIVKKLIKETNWDLEVVLQGMSKLFPKLENDLTLRNKLDKIPALQYNCEPHQVAQLFLELEELLNKMSTGSMSDQEKFILLTRKLHPKTFAEMRADRFFKRRTETFEDMKEALMEKAEEDWQEKHFGPAQKGKRHIAHN
jgi:hypothetical protein